MKKVHCGAEGRVWTGDNSVFSFALKHECVESSALPGWATSATVVVVKRKASVLLSFLKWIVRRERCKLLFLFCTREKGKESLVSVLLAPLIKSEWASLLKRFVTHCFTSLTELFYLQCRLKIRPTSKTRMIWPILRIYDSDFMTPKIRESIREGFLRND